LESKKVYFARSVAAHDLHSSLGHQEELGAFGGDLKIGDLVLENALVVEGYPARTHLY
jgi:hypothetical protein